MSNVVSEEDTNSYETEDADTILAPGAVWRKNVNIALPANVVHEIDRLANTRGTTRKSIIEKCVIEGFSGVQRGD